MRVVIEASVQAATARVAERVARAVREDPRLVLGVATGRTFEPVYARIAELHRAEDLSLARVTAFGLDEYVGAGPDDAWSLRRQVHQQLVQPTDLPPESVHLPRGEAPDVFTEALRYESAIRNAGGIDLQLLGIGRNGHIGFNEPGSSLGSATRAKALTRETLEANLPELRVPPDRLPEAAITAGLGTILRSRVCLLLATGSEKARAVAAMIEGPVAASVPASVLQHHPNTSVVLDPDAAGALAAREYYERAERLQRELEARS